MLAMLESERDRYTSGLDAELAAIAAGTATQETIEEVVLRLTEAVSLDRPVLILVDDAHWADRESRKLLDLLMQAVADRPLALLYTERIETTNEQIFEFTDSTIALHELNHSSMEALARTLLSGASDDVITTVAHQSRGRAIDIVTLLKSVADPATLTPSRASETIRAQIARDVALIDVRTREFLQICSLISDPIEYTLLKQLWPDDRELLSYIEACSGRYLRQEGDALHFVHAALAQSIRETVPIEIPYRRRIIDALEKLPGQRLEDIERLVDQSAASGDRAQEKRHLERLLEESERLQVLPVVARALEGIIALTPLSSTKLFSLYAKLSMVYNILMRPDDTHRVCSQALNYALSGGIDNEIGQLVASDLFALFFRGDMLAFRQTLEKFETTLRTPDDCAQLLSAKLLYALVEADEEAFAQARTDFEALGKPNPTFEIRYEAFNACRLARNGDTRAAIREIERARIRVQESDPVMGIMVADFNAQIAFQAYGPGHPIVLRALEALPKTHETRRYVTAMNLLAENGASDVLDYVSEQLVHLDPFTRRLLLGVAATASALTEASLPPSLWRLVEQDKSIALRDQITGWMRPVAAGAAAIGARMTEPWARDILRATFEASRRPPQPMVIFTPMVLVRAATLLNDLDVLEQIEAGAVAFNRDPWNTAQRDLARLGARASLGRPLARESVTALASTFESLGSPFFAGLTRELNPGPRRESAPPPGTALTKREREVASLVSEGGTNREIAERLVLSERTVEAHIANIFSKLGATSRAQLAVWYARDSGRANV